MLTPVKRPKGKRVNLSFAYYSNFLWIVLATSQIALQNTLKDQKVKVNGWRLYDLEFTVYYTTVNTNSCTPLFYFLKSFDGKTCKEKHFEMCIILIFYCWYDFLNKEEIRHRMLKEAVQLIDFINVSFFIMYIFSSFFFVEVVLE